MWRNKITENSGTGGKEMMQSEITETNAQIN